MDEAEKLFYTKQKQHYFLDMIEEDIHDISKQLPILRAQTDSSRNDSETTEACIATLKMLDKLRILDMPLKQVDYEFDESFLRTGYYSSEVDEMKIKSQGKTCRFDTLKAGDVFVYDDEVHLHLSGNDLRAVKLETGMIMLFDADDTVEYYENAYCCLVG